MSDKETLTQTVLKSVSRYAPPPTTDHLEMEHYRSIAAATGRVLDQCGEMDASADNSLKIWTVFVAIDAVITKNGQSHDQKAISMDALVSAYRAVFGNPNIDFADDKVIGPLLDQFQQRFT